MTEFERIVLFRHAYDKRDPDPMRNYGIGSVRLLMVLKGPAGAVSFAVLTDWYLPEVAAELTGKGHGDFEAHGAGLDYHSLVPTREGQNPGKPCCWLDDRPGYCDGSVTASDQILERLIREGSDAVWEELERFYGDRLDGLSVE